MANEDQKRSRVFSVRFSESEIEAIDVRSQRTNRTIGGFIRDVSLHHLGIEYKGPQRRRPSEEIATLRELVGQSARITKAVQDELDRSGKSLLPDEALGDFSAQVMALRKAVTLLRKEIENRKQREEADNSEPKPKSQ